MSPIYSSNLLIPYFILHSKAKWERLEESDPLDPMIRGSGPILNEIMTIHHK